jgi:energy-converting hydrogenase B subunit N
MRLFYIRETVMELQRMIGGNRVQYGVPIIGGVRPRAELDEMKTQKIREGIDYIREKVKEFADRFTSDPMIMSRITGICPLSRKDALRLAVTGPTLRATGVEFDLRREMECYDPFEFDIITQDDGDVKSNLLVRVFEIFESVKIIRQALDNLPEGAVVDRSWEMQDTDITKSYVEAPRGTLYHSYALEDGRVRNVVIRTPSMANIGAMQHALIGHHITDAQLGIVQCDPCFTCTDRAIEIVKI